MYSFFDTFRYGGSIIDIKKTKWSCKYIKFIIP